MTRRTRGPKRRPNPPTGLVRRGTRKWQQLRAWFIDHHYGGPDYAYCALCHRTYPDLRLERAREGRTTTPSVWHLDHVTPQRITDPHEQGLDITQLLNEGGLRILCQRCNTSRGARTDQYAQRRRNKQRTQQPTTNNNNTTEQRWRLQPKQRTNTDETSEQ